MSLSRRRFIAITAGALTATSTGATPQSSQTWRGVAMGADASLTISGRSSAEAKHLVDIARAEIQRMETIFSLYRPDSALSRLNASGTLKHPPFELVELLGRVEPIYRETAGAFDPTVQPVWALLADSRGNPTRAALKVALAKVDWRRVRYDTSTITFETPGMALTLNGIAQGYATDRVAAVLRTEGLENVLVSVGEIAAVGERQPGKPWLIGLSSDHEGAVDQKIELRDMAVATSTQRGTTLDVNEAVGHILHPRHGPAVSTWRRVSVIHPSATIADGLSTAFTLMERTDIDRVAARFGALTSLA